MGKFVFPMTEAEFLGAVKDKKIFDKLGGDIGFAFSCLKMGWMNKQHHKLSQMKAKEMDERIKQLMKADPELRARLLGHEAKKGV